MEHVRINESGDGVIILDQSLLPGEEKYIELKTPEEMHEAIFHLRVRGAPAIGIFAGYAMAAFAQNQADAANQTAPASQAASESCSIEDFIRKLRLHGDYLKSSRPTAVNLAWSVDRVFNVAENKAKQITAGKTDLSDFAPVAEAVRAEAVLIHDEDKAMCRKISAYGIEEMIRLGAVPLKYGQASSTSESTFGILTHCNAGPLATSEYGTALGPILMGHERGLNLRVFADETRPLLQGARLTAYELQRAGVDVTLICDNMASIVMKNEWVNAVFVGCDRVAANGDAANKIGTSGVAILAKHYGIPFYVLGPSSTIDRSCPSGEYIPIEERNPDEIREKFYEKPMAPAGVRCYNPSFDVTDHSLISGIITESGIFRPPYCFR